MPSAHQIQHDQAGRQFFAEIDGHRAVADYRLHDQIMTITHTGVPSALEGRGLGGALIKAALDTARMNGWKVVPACSFAAHYIIKHPEYQDLQAT